jgi:hypothetical protein
MLKSGVVGAYFQVPAAVAELLGSPQLVLRNEAEAAIRVAAVDMRVFTPDPVARWVGRVLGRDTRVTVRLRDLEETFRELCEAGGSSYTGWFAEEAVRIAAYCPALDGEVTARASSLGERHALPAAIVLQAHLRISGHIDDTVLRLVREGRLRAASGLTAGPTRDGRRHHAGSDRADPVSPHEAATLRSLGVHDTVVHALESRNKPVDLRAFLAGMLQSRNDPAWLPLPRPTAWGLAAVHAAVMLLVADSAAPDPHVLPKMALAAGLSPTWAIEAAAAEGTRRYALANLLGELLRGQAYWLLGKLDSKDELLGIRREVLRLLGGRIPERPGRVGIPACPVPLPDHPGDPLRAGPTQPARKLASPGAGQLP